MVFLSDLVFVVRFTLYKVFSILFFFFKHCFHTVIFQHCLNIHVSFLLLKLFQQNSIRLKFTLLIALHCLLLLSCFLPICMPKVEVCVPCVSIFTFRDCVFLYMFLLKHAFFPNNSTAKKGKAVISVKPTDQKGKICMQKGNYNQ